MTGIARAERNGFDVASLRLGAPHASSSDNSKHAPRQTGLTLSPWPPRLLAFAGGCQVRAIAEKPRRSVAAQISFFVLTHGHAMTPHRALQPLGRTSFVFYISGWPKRTGGERRSASLFRASLRSSRK